MNQLTGSIEKQTNDRETVGMKNRKPERTHQNAAPLQNMSCRQQHEVKLCQAAECS